MPRWIARRPGPAALAAWLLWLAIPAAVAEFSRDPSYSPATTAPRYEQRKQYQRAIYLITSGQRSRYLKLKDDLIRYPLYPYLEYTDMVYRMSRQTPESVGQFIDQYRDTPLAQQLLQNYLYSLGKRGRWDTFLTFYGAEEATKRNACFYAYALAKSGKTEEAMLEAGKLWLVDHSQPDECDPIFKLWRDAGNLDATIAWKRYTMGLKANEVTLANYLVRFLDAKDRGFASDMKLVHTRPLNLKRPQRFNTQHPHNREVILHGLKRLARRDPEASFDLLQQYKGQHAFEEVALADTYDYIGRRLATTDDTGGRARQLPVDLRSHPELVAALTRLALRQSDWSQVLVLIHLLPEDLQAEPRWQFWKARVLADSGDHADREMADRIFEQLAELRNFYGFLAADAQHLPYDYVNEPASVSDEEIKALELAPGIQRALELFAIGERTRARREWYFTTHEFSNRERAIAARVASRWGWYKPAIQVLIDAEAWNDLDYRFPVAYRETFISNARAADIPPNWSLAIARQESAFMPDAKSPSGALGIMQLMPATAKLTARYAGIKYKSSSELTDPSTNIRIGSQYLGQMLRRFNNNRILASAAYNAGPTRVDRWLDDQLSFDVWIETIPYVETRNYVQNVLMFAAIYGVQLNTEQPLIYPHEYLDFAAPHAAVAAPTTDRE